MKPPQNLKLCTQLTTRMYIREIKTETQIEDSKDSITFCQFVKKEDVNKGKWVAN